MNTRLRINDFVKNIGKCPDVLSENRNSRNNEKSKNMVFQPQYAKV